MDFSDFFGPPNNRNRVAMRTVDDLYGSGALQRSNEKIHTVREFKRLLRLAIRVGRVV